MKGFQRLFIAFLFVVALLFPLQGEAETDHSGEEAHSQHGHHMKVAADDQPMNEIFEDYFAIQASLAKDSMEGVPARAKASMANS